MDDNSRLHVLVSGTGLTKTFPGVIALDHVDFQVRAGEVNALVGENGAGKSTLIKIMAGFYKPDAGTILVNGKPLIPNPHAAHLAGIATIHQDHQLVPNMTVAENVILGNWKTKLGFISKRDVDERSESILGEIVPGLDLHKLAKQLSPAEAQLVEISKALSEDSQVLIMDEPTTSLSPKEIDRLFVIIEKLKNKGLGIVFVSHWLEQVFRISDQITVLRDGKLVDSVAANTMNRDDVIQKMVGRPIVAIRRSSNIADHIVLKVKKMTRIGVIKDISFDVRAGEIVTLVGLEGAGRSKIAECIFGSEKYDTGEILINGTPYKKSSPRDAINAGIGYVPEDRHSQALIPKMSVQMNLTIASLTKFTRLSWLLPKKETLLYESIAQSLRIKTLSPAVKVATLSGGNQQKVVLGRWLSLSPYVLILDEPTKGVDVGAKVEIERIIKDHSAHGTAVLLISSELPEVLSLSDRVIVIRSGRVAGELTGTNINQKSIMDLATSNS